MIVGANRASWVDYSPVNNARFRDAAQALPHGSGRCVQPGRDPEVTSRQQPSTQVCPRACRVGSLRDPSARHSKSSTLRVQNSTLGRTRLHLRTRCKDITRGEKTVGVFYGYLLQLCGEQRSKRRATWPWRGSALTRIDFVAARPATPPTVGRRGHQPFMSLLGQRKLHGKLWFDENDIRTSSLVARSANGTPGRNVAGDLSSRQGVANASPTR